MIEEKLKESASFEQAVRQALAELRGAYAVCILNEQEPGTLIAAKLGSPMVVGLGEGEFFVASDIPAILAHTREMVFMEDGEMVVFRCGSHRLLHHRRRAAGQEGAAHRLVAADGRKGGLPALHAQGDPRTAPRRARHHCRAAPGGEGDVYLEDLKFSDRQLAAVKRIVIVACGTSWHAALVGKFHIEEHCRIPVEVDIASEFRYRNPVIDDRHLVMLISQSGETADTLAALREAKSRGAVNMSPSATWWIPPLPANPPA